MNTKPRIKYRNLLIKGFITIVIMTNSVFASEVDVCVNILENITSPVNEYRCGSLLSIPPEPICAVNPSCCIPGVCKITPDCGFVKTTIETIVRKGDVHCFKDISTEKLWELWKDRQIAVTVDVLTGGLGEVVLPVVNADIQKITAQAKHMPNHLQNLLKEIISPVYDHGDTGYEHRDVSSIKIINKSHSVDTEAWVQKGAITLGTVVILGDKTYSQLIDSANNYTLSELLIGNKTTFDYSNALSTIVHELVHVKQYRELGQDTFIVNYLLRNAPVITDGYGHGKYEQEAYSFTPSIFEFHGGELCKNVVNEQNLRIKEFNLKRGEMKCKPYIAWMIPFL